MKNPENTIWSSYEENVLIEDSESRKNRGIFYTPEDIAIFLVDWAIRSPNTSVLEPSCGNGLLIECAIKRLLSLGVKKEEIGKIALGVEIDSGEVKKTISRLSQLKIPLIDEIVVKSDFFKYCKSNLWERRSFNAIIGNPPFIRYQQFKKEKEIAFELMRGASLHPNGHTNIWVPFLVISSLLLDDKGLLAMVIPAELFQVKYAAETRRFLSKYFNKLTIVTFKKLVLDGPLQEVVLLLGERNNGQYEGIRVIEIEDVAELNKLGKSITEISSRPFLTDDTKPLNHGEDKWTQYFLEKEEILLLKDLLSNPDVIECKNLFAVDIGVVTGKNKFFVLTEAAVSKKKLNTFTTDIIASSSALEGIRFSQNDWKKNVAKGMPTFLFKPPIVTPDQFPPAVKDYIHEGEKRDVQKGYKCRIRKEWYRVPTIWSPDGFIIRQIHDYPKLVLNKTSATCTDTIHRVRFLKKEIKENVVVAFLNSMTFAFTEVIGRSYGGGILTLEPSEAERLPIPMKGSEKLNFNDIDKLIRRNSLEAVLEKNDKILLERNLGLKKPQIMMLRGIWRKLRDRRQYRGRKTKTT